MVIFTDYRLRTLYLSVMVMFYMGLTMVAAQNIRSGIFETSRDVGTVTIPGSLKYDAESQSYTLSGSGTNMWFGIDAFHYAYRRISGDFIVQAMVQFMSDGIDPHRKMGWILRNSLDTASEHVNAAVHGDGLTSLQYRSEPGGETKEIKLAITGSQVIQLERRKGRFIMSAAVPGGTFHSVELDHDTLTDTVYAGIYVCAHNPDVLEKAIFHNVRIIIPAEGDFVPYRDYIGSHLEILDVETSIRRIIHTSKNSIQAPNWTPDGVSLIYNSEGLLYNFDLESGMSRVVPTGFATSNNNDHVLSFDGKFLGISHHSSNHGGSSIIYTIPITGGEPKQVTPNGPSYLHGWSPDGRELVYTGGRNGKYDIYKIPAGGGMEIQLTDTEGLDDGPEYTPDGRYIYFNSNRTGTMQIWRMKPDGADQEQVTFDEYNDWFPHISPDGKWIVFLSYGKEVSSGDHPFYKNVFLRRMPMEGGEPECIAYLYGGQGTINVPSWSPDSRKIAFVSNSGMEGN